MLKIFNTLSRKKEQFEPINNSIVSIYVCGMTVYDLCHIGHARTFTAFDMITRYLRYLGYKLNYVRNITDIDDKIIQRSQNDGKDITYLTQCMINNMHQDFSMLNILPPNHEPRATWHIAEIILLIKKLVDRKHAYISYNKDVLFSIERYPKYGLLSRKDLRQLKTNVRVSVVSTQKRNPADFVLWKISKDGEPSWPSPWGNGRPGWHVECSAMSYTYLGKRFDIHGGGSDLIFPHHENEITQSACAYDTPYANYWMHSGMVMVDQEKMSKSLNNFFTIRDVLKYYNSESVRYFLLSSHYRSSINYNPESLQKAHTALERLYRALYCTDMHALISDDGKEFEIRFCEAMNDDFNTPIACSILFELAREINRKKEKNPTIANNLAARLRLLGGLLGLLEQDPEKFFKGNDQYNKNYSVSHIEKLIQIRNNARKEKDWKKADLARYYLDTIGVLLEDTIDGTRWRNK
ncbi:cysteine--tRNA ligase [Candidatus Erwinia haradaeae]|uniref:Cysteine--tRNA ligase n=1 Tax=Candidatus Erwinia haradaeae TaxID=1922217 RepID=A0A451D2D0_9GAMM|nr:cysteine--tRNA ligase [Candidatus Erwinia haradaeae]VFP79795.1 Cysteine--tRNA ligase [Candidatus Erwinia haradaeae]